MNSHEDKKQCTRCGVIKNNDDYYSQKIKDKEGKIIRIYRRPYCKLCENKRMAEYSKENPGYRSEAIKRYNSRPEKKKQIKEANILYRQSGKAKEWRRNNKDKVKKYQENRKLHKEHDITLGQRDQCKVYFNNRCAYCGITEKLAINKYKQKLHMDHVINNGKNDLSNAVPACKGCNASKGVLPLLHWYLKQEFFEEDRLKRIYNWLNKDYIKTR